MKPIAKFLITSLSIMFISFVAGNALQVNPLWIGGSLVFIAIAQTLGMWLLGGQSLKGILYVLAAYTPCTDVTSTQTPAGNCLEEGSGVPGFLLVKKGFNIATIVDDTTYTAAKTARDIIVVKDLEAFMPAGTQQVIPGLRGRMERHGHWLFDMPFKHEGVDANLKFWNYVTQSRDYGVCFITEEYKAFMPLDRQLEPVICSISAAPSGDQEFGKTRFMMGNVKWKHKDLPYLVDNLTVAMLQPDFQV